MTTFEQDLENHKLLVKEYMNLLISQLKIRRVLHDLTKYQKIEKENFEKVSHIKREDFNSYEEWFETTKPMLSEALKHHYAKNRHHPEHFSNGVAGMNLVDIVEMIVDWQASAEARGTELDVEYCFKRFNIEPQLQSIIKNTLDLLNGLTK